MIYLAIVLRSIQFKNRSDLNLWVVGE